MSRYDLVCVDSNMEDDDTIMFALEELCEALHGGLDVPDET